MATSWAEIISAAMVPIDDIRLQEQLEISPALFYRRMSLYLKAAMPLLSRPPELLGYLRKEMTEAAYTEYEWVSTAESTVTEATVATGAVGYDLCSCIMVETLDDGRVMQTPCAVTYDSETGDVTFPVQESAGTAYQMDFYTDGTFDDLTEIQIRLFAQAIALVWDERFTGDWLSRTPKINDSSFTTVNEANWTEKTSQAHLRKEQAFHEELKHYEQLCAYQTRVSNRGIAGVELI